MNENNGNDIAGAADPTTASPLPDEATTIFPVMFEKDDMDFRPQEADELVVAPKGGSVQGYVSAPSLTTGLEDVSSDDLQTPSTPETPVPKSAATDSSKASPRGNGKQTS